MANRKVLSLSAIFALTIFMFSLAVPFCAFAQSENAYVISNDDVYQEGSLHKPYNSEVTLQTADGELNYKLIDALYNAIYNMEDRLPVIKYTANKNTFVKNLRYVIDNNPELFYFDLGNSLMYYDAFGDQEFPYISQIVFAYKYTKEEVLIMRTQMQNERDNILSCVTDDMTDVEKILTVHDYFAVNYKYDYTYTIYDAYNIMVNKTGVCQAYSLAFKYVMDSLNIKCSYVTSDNINHMWNIVCANGKWYHVDVTHDDPSIGTASGYSSDGFGYAGHTYFMLSDKELLNTDKNRADFASAYTADDTTYDDFFLRKSGINHAVSVYNGLWYYTNGQEIYTYNPNTKSNTVLYTPETQIYEVSSGRYYWKYTDIYVKNGYLYFTLTDRIMSFNLKTKEVSEAHIFNLPEGKYVFGMYHNNGVLYIGLSDYYFCVSENTQYTNVDLYDNVTKTYNGGQYNISISMPDYNFADNMYYIAVFDNEKFVNAVSFIPQRAEIKNITYKSNNGSLDFKLIKLDRNNKVKPLAKDKKF